MKRYLLPVLLLLIATLVVTPLLAQDAPLLVAINKSADQQYFIDLQTSFAAAATELGAEARTFNAALDPNLGISLVQDAISAGAAGIAITVPDQTIGPAIAQLAADAGVVLIATDDNISDADGNPVPFVGFNGTDMGPKVGEEAARLLTESGWLDDSSLKVGVLSTQVETLSVCMDRTNASTAAMLDAGVPEENIFPVPYTGETISAQDAAGPVITANPDVTHWVVFACNDEGVLGTLNALASRLRRALANINGIAIRGEPGRYALALPTLVRFPNDVDRCARRTDAEGAPHPETERTN